MDDLSLSLDAQGREVMSAVGCAQNAIGEKGTMRAHEFWDLRLTSAQVRKMSRNTPAIQVNVAAAGGQQVNVQGDVRR